LDLSDVAIKWVIAHELGHVASGLSCESLSIGGLGYTRTSENVYRAITGAERELHELVADAIAHAWGWWEEEKVWVKEVNEGGN
jgi:predicted metalloprotease